MTVASGSNYFSITWNTLHAIISGNTIDPSARGKKFIFGTFPDVESTNFPGFPIISISPIKSDSTKQTYSYNSIDENILTSDIFIHSKSNHQLEVLSDDVRDAIQSNKAKFAASGISLISIMTGGTDTDIVGNDRVHYKHLIPRFKVTT